MRATLCFPIKSYMKQKRHVPVRLVIQQWQTLKPGNLHNEVLTGKVTVEEACMSQELPRGITCTRNAFMYTCSRCISFMKPIQRCPDTSTKGSTLDADQISSGAGLSPDLVIEQVLVGSMKTSEGLTRGRGMTEPQRLVWLMAHPVCAEVNNAMQHLTGVQYNASEQHKHLTTARQGKYMTDSCELLEFLEYRNPFSDNCSFRSIAT